MKERTIATYITNKFRLQLVEINYYSISDPKKYIPGVPAFKYEVRLNRKIVKRSISGYEMRKLFAMYVQNQVLQQKI